MNNPIQRLHHLTAISAKPRENLEFYTKILGLRLVKKTVNFDDPSAYHLYYGDESGTPGSIVTFFFWAGESLAGSVGAGQSTRLSFSAPLRSLSFWKDRLDTYGVSSTIEERLEEQTLQFFDPDGIPVEIVAVDDDPRKGWTIEGVGERNAIRGMHTFEVTVLDGESTRSFLSEEMGFRMLWKNGDRSRWATGEAKSGAYVDLVENDTLRRGRPGSGTIHHLAFSIEDRSEQDRFRNRLVAFGHGVSPVMDRDYFESIYFRESGGTLFEIATEGPGFSVDEAPEKLGEGLKLPTQYAGMRQQIERILPSLG